MPSRKKTLFGALSYTIHKDRMHKDVFSEASTLLEDETDEEGIQNKVVSIRNKAGIDPCCIVCRRPHAPRFLEYHDDIIFFCDQGCLQELDNHASTYLDKKYIRIKFRVESYLRVIGFLAALCTLLAPLLSACVLALSAQ